MKDNLNQLLEFARGNDNVLEHKEILQILELENPDEKTSEEIREFLKINQVAIINLEADEAEECIFRPQQSICTVKLNH